MMLTFSCVYGGRHQVVGDVWYRIGRATGERPERYERYLCETLNTFAQTPQDCDRILHYLDDVELANQPEIVAGGNDVTLKISSAGVQVDIDINPDWTNQSDGKFTLNEFRSTLTVWKRFLEMPKGGQSSISVALP